MRVEAQIQRIITWLRVHALVPEGTREPKDKNYDLTRMVIRSNWWQQADARFDSSDSSLWIGEHPNEKCVFSDIRMIAPETAKSDKSLANAEEQPLRSKGGPGRKPKWDWNGATRELLRVANSLDGLPHPQAEVEKLVRNWFIATYDDSPSESAIRQFVSKLLPPGYHSDN